MNKDRHILGGLQEFFTNKESDKAITVISRVMNSIRIQGKTIGSVKNQNCKFTCLQVLQRLVLFPFFSVKNAASYPTSAPGRLFACKKDMFYRFMNDGNVNWRRIIHSVFRQLNSRITRMQPILGFKAMFLCFTDGVSQFMLDFSLHGEEG